MLRDPSRPGQSCPIFVKQVAIGTKRHTTQPSTPAKPQVRMAQRLTIVQSAIPGFSLLANLSDKDFNDFFKSIESLPVGALFSAYSKYVHVQSLGEEDNEMLSRLVLNFGPLLYSVRKDDKALTPEEVTDAFIEKTNAQFDEGTKQLLVARMARLLRASGSVYRTFKAFMLLQADPSIIREVSIYTDIRPVFEEKTPIISTLGSVIIHRLSVVFQDGKNTKTLSFAMDVQDLKELRKAVDRALEKESALHSDSANKTIQFIRD